MCINIHFVCYFIFPIADTKQCYTFAVYYFTNTLTNKNKIMFII